MEVWYGLAAATICLMVVAVSFQMVLQKDVISALLPGRMHKSEYAKLSTLTLVIQWFSLVVPVAVISYQLLIAFDKAMWLIPRPCRHHC